jgi:tRNA(adenine34) deaminase
MAKKRASRRWISRVKTVSTFPPAKTFAGSASQIARTMARKDVSPKGLGSAIRMIQYFINRGGRRLSATRRRELERAKRILQRRRAHQTHES